VLPDIFFFRGKWSYIGRTDYSFIVDGALEYPSLRIFKSTRIKAYHYREPVITVL
jgi:hypothetical protein